MKFWKMLALLAVMVAEVGAQDSFNVDLINTYRDKTTANREAAYAARSSVVALRPVAPTTAQLQTLVVQCYESNGLTASQLNTVDSVRTAVCDTLGYTVDPLEMLSEWGMDANDPMTQMMLPYMTGPWKHESLWGRVDRLLTIGDWAKEDGIVLDQLNAMYEVMHQYALNCKASASGVDPFNMLMYDMMISWSETQLVGGYISSANKWQKASTSFSGSSAALKSINDYYDLVKRMYDIANPQR